ncbi:SDR family NAD(P)-dependent oxidoreductase [Tomitella fengzijianii]|uniref:SDR family NAD(P)-dependent oxidoreductase n=1 Tax=Tomitella fengzijianii TaxID=2597660 RepID=A0A516WYW7_9ACTN|nr:SDR family NAD(P)-dependent oxidoreductase [Tomitella fengzijianii]QDQ96034.1 SDR family NAD(P)-dependent oxidoreductase [Tomitella fengzijianii]
MGSVSGKVAVVTGAASGIGRELALELARRGAKLALADVDDRGLAQTEGQVRALGAEASGSHLDVSSRADFETFAQDVVTRFGVVHQIYNNAGISGGSHSILDSDYAVFDRVLGINLWGVIHGTKTFLPHLIASGDGHVINISSLNGIMAQPELGPYCTAKFGVRGFTETLRAEMLADQRPVAVTVVHPGGVKTNIASAALAQAESRGEVPTDRDRVRVRTYNDKLLKLPADKAARTIVDGVEDDRARVLVGNDAKALDLLVRAAPRFYTGLIAKYTEKIFG